MSGADPVEARLAAIERRLERIEGKLDAATTGLLRRLPRWWQVPAVVATTVSVCGLALAAGKKMGLW